MWLHYVYMNLAVIGSRRRSEPELIARELSRLKPDCVITGGAIGIDTEAERIAGQFGFAVRVIRPDLANPQSRGAVMKAIRERNEKIIEAADMVMAFPSVDRKGGTEMGIKHARRIGKPLVILASNEP